MSKASVLRNQAALARVGVSAEDADKLRRIAMTLTRWGELECGVDGCAIERDDITGKPFWTYDAGSRGRGRYPIADRERGAVKRLRGILEGYPHLIEYYQTDPRGASVYIIERDKIGMHDIDSVYTRGVAVLP